MLPHLLPLVLAASTALAIDPFINATVYAPRPNTTVSYARTETLPDGSLLAVWNSFSENNESLPIYRSRDDGKTWSPHGRAHTDVPGRRLVQPHLLWVNASAGFRGWDDDGALLLAVNAADNRSTNIEIYGSRDWGRSFEFVSRVASGGRGNTTNGATPVWEPFLMVHERKLICYYSDQRDREHGQKLAHQTSTEDFDSWGSVINDVAFTNYTDRPGMTTVVKMGNGQFILTFEYAHIIDSNDTYKYPIYYKLSYDPENFGTADSHKLIPDNPDALPNGGPTVAWTPWGGANGTIIVSDSDSNPVWTNQMLGKGIWKEIQTSAGRSYSKEMRIPYNDNTKLRITGGAEYDQVGPSKVQVTILDLGKALNQTA
ncbi:hypothetical protein EJ04DRAFT_608203 [Polyplosphaeria fusca]|uniref:Glycoside hydrolase family 93 protein n=1 Tax=Polyplosphaeria fusca TaxID=682080 RepID=A0A9P4QWD7_9PLEO|nr:hypothetical protein EJ04DRAFT_608203 [Polyplosphaeria fusca]